MLKVEDGCVNFCTYCIIPYARGPSAPFPWGRPPVRQSALPGRDYRELVLDRPFCYAVVDLERGVPLFLGTFERP